MTSENPPSEKMTPERWQQVKHLLDELLDSAPEERAALLEEHGAGDPALRQEVESLLAAYDEADDLDTGAFSEDLFGSEGLLNVEGFFGGEGAHVGPYRLEGVLGSGGMGTVYRARRDDAHYERAVALKVIRPGLYTEEVLRRFRAERQILASLEHPRIARLYDGGLTADGRPYFAMELVEGTPLDRYCEAETLPVEARLRLFEKAVEAVAEAHRRLVVHRDLKPSNVLVTDAGEPMLLDFGIAKLLEAEESTGGTKEEAQVEKAQAEHAHAEHVPLPLTRTGQQLMTPEYAAPEQVRGEAVTPATDVYALGVLLYELLTGRRPYRFEQRTPSHIEQVICERQPARPSTAVTHVLSEAPHAEENASEENASEENASEERLASEEVAQDRRSMRFLQPSRLLGSSRLGGSSRLSRQLRGDLDRIVMKALRKEPERRYASAAELAADLRRHREGLPVEAREATWRYRAGKFVRRHRWGVTAAAVLALLLTGYAATVTVQSRRLAAERDRAKNEAAKAEQVSTFLKELFKASDPYETSAGQVTLQDILRQGSHRVRTELGGQPLLQAEMLHLLGEVYQSQAQYDSAQVLLEETLETRRRVLGDDHLQVAATWNQLGSLFREMGRLDTAAASHRRALAIRRRQLANDHGDVAASLNNLASVFYDRGELEAAAPLFQEALEINRRRLGDEHVDVAGGFNNLANLHYSLGNLEEAEQLYRKTLSLDRALLGKKHPYVATDLSSLGLALHDMERYKEAEQYLHASLEMRRDLLGPAHTDIAISLHNLGHLFISTERYEEAERVFREALAMRRDLLDPDHPRIASNLHGLGALYHEKGDRDAAERYYREAVAMQKRLSGEDSKLVAGMLLSLGSLLRESSRYAEAATLYETALDAHRPLSDERHPDEEKLLEGLIQLYTNWGKPRQAAAWQDSLQIDSDAPLLPH